MKNYILKLSLVLVCVVAFTTNFSAHAYYSHPFNGYRTYPVTQQYCEVNREYTFAVSPSVTQCVCPTYSTYTNLNQYQFLGSNHFVCVANYNPVPAPVMQRCSNGTIISTNAICPRIIHQCSYNEYWNGYSCVQNYQQYYQYQNYPIIYPYNYNYYDNYNIWDQYYPYTDQIIYY